MSLHKPRWLYQRVEEEDQKQQQASPKKLLLLATSALAIALLFTTLGVFVGKSLPTNRPSTETAVWHNPTSSLAHAESLVIEEYTGCGNSVEEALAHFCQFDPMSFSWLPRACYDSDLVDEFRSLEQWSWYADASDAMPVEYAKVIQGEFPYLWVTRKFHLFHCTYQWRKMHRAILHNAPLDSYIGNYTHTEHCEGVLTRGVPELSMDIVDVRIQRKFVECGRQESKELYQAVDSDEDHEDHTVLSEVR